MESSRDIRRTMENEIRKGSCPLTFARLGTYSYNAVDSEEKLEQVLRYLLRVGEYGSLAGKTVINNIYRDIGFRGLEFKRARSVLDRQAILKRICRYAGKKKPGYDGKCYVEQVDCVFSVPEEERSKYHFVQDGNDTYAFPLSNKYIQCLYLQCCEARKEAAATVIPDSDAPAVERGMQDLTAVKDGLFQALLLDDIKENGTEFVARLYSIYMLI